VRPVVAKANLVQAFRGEMRAAIPLHEHETKLVVAASLHLCFLPWALGAVRPWAQVISLVFGVLALVLALLPRRYEGELAPGGSFTLLTFPRLLRFPLFWLGGLFLLYVLCQALNPAWLRVTAGPYWWISQLPHKDWLPTSVSAPFANMNAWRMLCIWGGAWLLVCALWIGLTRRVAAQTILNVLVINGSVLALVGILEKVTGATKILWFVEPGAATTFVATFFYKNHAGAYLNLVFVAATGLMVWHYVRSLRRLERSSPAPVYAFACILVASLVFMTRSRSAMLLLAAYFVVCVFVLIIWRTRSREVASSPTVNALMGVGALAIIVAATTFLDLDKSVEQIRRLTNEDRMSAIESRVQARTATLDLFEAEPWTGWGAGSFRHAFPLYQKKYPDIYKFSNGQGMFWDHAHNDYVQALAELGGVGFAFPVLMLLWLFYRLCRMGAVSNPAFFLFMTGLGLPLVHGWLDFPLYNCAIFTTACALGVLLTRWIELENSRS